jgi:hypothetical protein
MLSHLGHDLGPAHTGWRLVHNSLKHVRGGMGSTSKVFGLVQRGWTSDCETDQSREEDEEHCCFNGSEPPICSRSIAGLILTVGELDVFRWESCSGRCARRLIEDA